MQNITLDSNCIIDLEQNNSTASHLEKLIQMHLCRVINLRVVAISGSERKRDHTYPSNLKEFKQRISQIGLGDVEILPTPCYQGLSFEGYSIHSGEKSRELEREIQQVMFPTIEFDFMDFCKNRRLNLDNKKARQKWINAKCDVLTLWSHIQFKGDILVTKDKDFHKKTVKPRLITLGAGKILKPDEAVKLLLTKNNAR